MRLTKILLRYIFVIVAGTFTSAILTYLFYPLFINDNANSFLSTLGFCAVFIFIGYNVYLIISRLFLSKTDLRPFYISILGFFSVIISWMVLQSLMSYLMVASIYLNLLGIGVGGLIMPLLHNKMFDKTNHADSTEK